MNQRILLGTLALLTAAACLGQTPEVAKFYKLDFMLKEMENGKVLNARVYSSLVSTKAHNSSSIRTGSKVVVVTSGATTAVPAQFNYIDVGVSVDCNNVHEVNGGLALEVSADVSTIPQDTTEAHPVGGPTIRQNRWRSDSVVVPLHTPTVIFSSDDLTSRRVMQLEITANPVKSPAQ